MGRRRVDGPATGGRSGGVHAHCRRLAWHGRDRADTIGSAVCCRLSASGSATSPQCERLGMTLPGVSVLDAAFALSVAGVAALTGNPIGAGLTMLVAAAWFGLSAWLADRRAEPAE